MLQSKQEDIIRTFLQSMQSLTSCLLMKILMYRSPLHQNTSLLAEQKTIPTVKRLLQVVGQAIALILGFSFIALQVAAAQGIITVNWSHVQERMTKLLDTNSDGCVSSQ